MKSVRIILLGIATILFGFFCYYVGNSYPYRVLFFLGMVIAIVGLIISVSGFFAGDGGTDEKKDDKKED